METAKNLHEVSAFYFFILGFAYVFLALAFRNGLIVDWALLFMRLFDIPLALVALIYGGTTLYLQLNENEETVNPWSIVIVAACILLFGLVVFVNFAFPSKL